MAHNTEESKKNNNNHTNWLRKLPTKLYFFFENFLTFYNFFKIADLSFFPNTFVKKKYAIILDIVVHRIRFAF